MMVEKRAARRKIEHSGAGHQRQRAAYDDLFPKLRALRTQLFPQNNAPIAIAAPEHPHPEWAEKFFSGMDLDEIQQKKPLTPVPPGSAK